VSFGDGWHNNHHAYPVSARHGLKWYEIDLNWYTIWILKQFGLVSHIHRAALPAGKHLDKSLAPVE
jgi:fatty-acid desaturase